MRDYHYEDVWPKKVSRSDPTMPSGKVVAQRIISSPRVHINGKVWHLDNHF